MNLILQAPSSGGEGIFVYGVFLFFVLFLRAFSSFFFFVIEPKWSLNSMDEP